MSENKPRQVVELLAEVHRLEAPVRAIIIRHPKERSSKCTLTPLRERPDLLFFRGGEGRLFDATGCLLLSLGAPELRPEEFIRRPDGADHQDRTGLHPPPLLILDATWKLLPRLQASITGQPLCRSLPRKLRTAYPRRNEAGEDPAMGLASVEALQVGLWLLGHQVDVLQNFHWRHSFLAKLPSELKSMLN